MLLVYAILVVLMFVCAAWLHCSSQEHFVDTPATMKSVAPTTTASASAAKPFASAPVAGPPATTTEIINVYENVLQRQPSAKELTETLAKKWSTEDIEGRLMDSDEYQRIIKVQSNSLTPELDMIIHEKKQLAYLASVYFAERTANIPPALLMPLRDIYIYLEYEEAAFRFLLQDAKYPDFEKRLTDTFQLSKEKTIKMFDDTFSKKDLLARARDAVASAKQTEIRDPPMLTRTYDAVSDSKPTGKVNAAVVAAAAPTKKEGFENYAPANVAPVGTSLSSHVSRTIHDKDSDLTPMLYDVEQRSKNIFDIHQAAKKLDDTPDAFVYVPVVPVRYEAPATHYVAKPPGNHDPFVSDLFGCFRGAPVPAST